MDLDPSRRSDAARDYYAYDGDTPDPTAPSASTATRASAPGAPAPGAPANAAAAANGTTPAAATRGNAGSPAPDAHDPLGGRSHGRAAADFVRRSARPPAGNDSVLYLGMNTTAGQNALEASRLRQDLGGTGAHLEVVAHGESDPAVGPGHVRIKGANGGSTIADLGTEAGIQTFTASLRLPPDQAAAVAGVLGHASRGGRDELAGLASVFARGERGESIPSRLLLSGHCAGPGLYDGKDPSNFLSFEAIKSLAQALPRGASMVDDLMFSACSTGFDGAEASGGRTPLSSWKEAFPNLKTAWGYGTTGAVHSSPTGEGAVADTARWEKATRGATSHLHVDIHHVSTWDARDGYRVGGGE